MPAIPTYERQTAAPDTVRIFHQIHMSGAAPIGQGLADVGQGISQLTADLQKTEALRQQAAQKQADERSKVWSGEQAGQSMLTEMQALEEARNKAPPGADGFAKSYLEGFDERAAISVASAPDEKSKAYLQQHVLAQRTHFADQAFNFQFKAADDDAVNRFTSATGTWAKAVQQDPAQYGAATNVLGNTMPDVVPQVRAKLTDNVRTALTNAAAATALDRNPYVVQAATGKALGEGMAPKPPNPDGTPVRAEKTGVPWVDDATPDQVRTWNNAALVKIKGIESAMNVTQDRQETHSIGAIAFSSVAGGGSGALPRDTGGKDVAPYKPADIDRINAFVRAPSPYDDLIQQAAKKYNIDPAEIKMRIAVESSGNPKAVNPKSGATGLAQLMPNTATQYGVTDRTDPAQSIDALARIVASAGGTKGGDSRKADRAYYGGNTNAKGPNTDQYVENLGAVRQALINSGTMPQLSTAQLEYSEAAVLDTAAQMAEQKRPGDVLYRDQAVTAARSNWSKAIQAQRGQDYGNFSTVLAATIKTGATSTADLPPDALAALSKLTPQNYLGIQSQFDRNVKAANGEYTKSDLKLVNDLTQRIYLPDGDPGKITYPGQLSEFMGKGLNYTDQQRLITQMKEANTPEGNPFLKQAHEVKQTARKMLTMSMSSTAIAHPDIAEEAAYRFGADLDAKIKAARAAKQDPQQLFVPGGKDYVLDPGRVSSFMPTEGQIAASKAKALESKPASAAAPVAARKPGETAADYLKRVGMS